jgi:uncharacterized protein YbjT (DUF2867 family)
MIPITGATGTLGREIVQRLSARAVPVRVVTRGVRRAEANAPLGVQFFQGDFDDSESMQRACAGVERAFLLTNSTERAGQQQQIAFRWTACSKSSQCTVVVRLPGSNSASAKPWAERLVTSTSSRGTTPRGWLAIGAAEQPPASLWTSPRFFGFCSLSLAEET